MNFMAEGYARDEEASMRLGFAYGRRETSVRVKSGHHHDVVFNRWTLIVHVAYSKHDLLLVRDRPGFLS